MQFFKDNIALVQYVADQAQYLKPGSQWTMTITAGKYEDFSVRTVTDTSSDDTDPLLESNFFETQVNT